MRQPREVGPYRGCRPSSATQGLSVGSGAGEQNRTITGMPSRARTSGGLPSGRRATVPSRYCLSNLPPEPPPKSGCGWPSTAGVCSQIAWSPSRSSSWDIFRVAVSAGLWTSYLVCNTSLPVGPVRPKEPFFPCARPGGPALPRTAIPTNGKLSSPQAALAIKGSLHATIRTTIAVRPIPQLPSCPFVKQELYDPGPGTDHVIGPMRRANKIPPRFGGKMTRALEPRLVNGLSAGPLADMVRAIGNAVRPLCRGYPEPCRQRSPRLPATR